MIIFLIRISAIQNIIAFCLKSLKKNLEINSYLNDLAKCYPEKTLFLIQNGFSFKP